MPQRQRTGCDRRDRRGPVPPTHQYFDRAVSSATFTASQSQLEIIGHGVNRTALASARAARSKRSRCGQDGKRDSLRRTQIDDRNHAAAAWSCPNGNQRSATVVLPHEFAMRPSTYPFAGTPLDVVLRDPGNRRRSLRGGGSSRLPSDMARPSATDRADWATASERRKCGHTGAARAGALLVDRIMWPGHFRLPASRPRLGFKSGSRPGCKPG
jgi:hypothetical protein